MERVKRPKLVAGNWKMHGLRDFNTALIDKLLLASDSFNDMEVVICPPFTYLSEIHHMLKDSEYKLGAQNVYCEMTGAYTGEISPTMLQDVGCKYVIIGHSERRQHFGETNTLIARKFRSAYHVGLVPILCVGESETQRQEDLTFQVIEEQLKAVLDLVPIQAFKRAVIAYEPVWAIGTGLTASPEQAEAVHKFLRDRISSKDSDIASQLPIIYGGSVKSENAADLFKEENIDGALVGGASLNATDFLAICRLASRSFSVGWSQ